MLESLRNCGLARDPSMVGELSPLTYCEEGATEETPMKPKLDFDPEFRANSRRWYWPIRSIGQLMIVIALGGVVLSVVPVGSRQQARPSRPLRRFVPNATLLQGPVLSPQGQAGERQPPDRFVVIAPAEIDPGMVVWARPDLDAGMVFDPYARRRSLPTIPMPGSGPAAPGPDGGGRLPFRWAPQPPMTPQPR